MHNRKARQAIYQAPSIDQTARFDTRFLTMQIDSTGTPSGWMLGLLAMAQLIIALDATIVFVALPEIGAALHFSAHQLQWVISAYTVAFGGALLLGGRATDLLGRRRMYMLGQALYATSSFAGGLADSGTLLIAARAVQGLGGALLFPATLALINTNFAEGPARNRALAIWSAASAAGLALGALAGGVLTEAFGWASIFLVNVPLAGGAALAAPWLIHADGPREHGRSFDVAGALSVTAGGTLLVFTLVQGPESGWLSWPIVTSLVVALVCLALFFVIEQRSRDPLMPLRLLRNPNLRAAMVLTFVFMSTFGVQYYFLALYYQDVYGWSVLRSGLAFLPATVLCTVGIHFAERLLPHIGAGPTLAAGLGAGAMGLAAIWLMLPGGHDFWSLMPGVIIMSIGQGMTWTSMWVTAAMGVAPREQGVASGMASTAQQIGGALGLAVLVAVANAGMDGLSGPPLREAEAQGIRNALAWTAAIAAAGMMLALRIRRKDIAEARTTSDASAPHL